VDDVGWSVALICVFAAGTLFFSVNSIALRIYSSVKLYEAFKSAGKEDQLEKFVDNTERFVLSCGLYRLVANVCLVLSLLAFFAARRADGLHVADFVLTFIIAVVLFSLFSLAIPHAWAKYTGEKVLSRTNALLMILASVAAPLLFLFRLYDGLVRRLAGVTQVSTETKQEEKEEEFLNVVEQRKMEGVVDEEEQEMIENVLELSDTDVENIMTPRTDIVAVSAEGGLEEVLATISKAGHSRIPVYEQNIDNIIGLIYAKDLLGEIGNDPANFKIRDKMRKAYFVPETKSLRQLLHEFQNQKLHIAIVLDEYGGTAGIVTIEDILEELVGEIADEYEEPVPESIKRLDENTVEVDARMYIDDLNKEFELQLPEDEDYDTVGGFVFSHLGYIPGTGQTFDYEDLKFIISSAEARRIKRIKIQKIPAQPKSSQ